MGDKLIIIISGSAVLNLTLLTALSWFKSKDKPSAFWLGWLFFATAAAILDNTLIFVGQGTILFYHLGIATNLAWGGYLIAYISSLRNPAEKAIKFNWKLFIPAYLYLPFLILTLIEPQWGKDSIKLAEVGKMTPFGIYYNFSICLYSIISNAVLLWQEYFRRSKWTITETSHKRIKEILWVMLILQLMAFIPFLLKTDIKYIILYMPVFGQVFFLYIFFRMSNSTQLFFEVDSIQEKACQAATKYATFKQNEDKTEKIKKQIIELMDSQKPYLRMDYTLTEMAKDLKVLPNMLSMVINSKLNCSFPEYVNSLRIKTAIELLNRASKNNLTIEAIAYESGFNNRTSFYNAFKKETGKLPSEYLKKEPENTKEFA